METKLKQKLPETSPFEVIEKISVNFTAASSKVPSFRSSETPKTRMHGSDLFRHVKVNYPYKRKIQPKLY